MEGFPAVDLSRGDLTRGECQDGCSRCCVLIGARTSYVEPLEGICSTRALLGYNLVKVKSRSPVSSMLSGCRADILSRHLRRKGPLVLHGALAKKRPVRSSWCGPTSGGSTGARGCSGIRPGHRRVLVRRRPRSAHRHAGFALAQGSIPRCLAVRDGLRDPVREFIQAMRAATPDLSRRSRPTARRFLNAAEPAQRPINSSRRAGWPRTPPAGDPRAAPSRLDPDRSHLPLDPVPPSQTTTERFALTKPASRSPPTAPLACGSPQARQRRELPKMRQTQLVPTARIPPGNRYHQLVTRCHADPPQTWPAGENWSRVNHNQVIR